MYSRTVEAGYKNTCYKNISRYKNTYAADQDFMQWNIFL